jgi:enoyl-CoA hydratase/carnithine racemase
MASASAAAVAPPRTPWVKVRLDQTSVPTLLLDRPQALNALNLDMVQALMQNVTQLERAHSANAILLQAAPGSRAFCAGGDVKSLVQAAISGTPAGVAQAASFFTHEYRLNHKLGTLRKPLISILDGITMGGGVGLSVHGAFRVVTERTVFAMPETAIGFVPDVGGSFFLPRLEGEVGTYLGLTGARLKGQEVFLAGIGTHYIPSTRLPALYQQLQALEEPSFAVVNRILDSFVGDLADDAFDAWSLGGAVGAAIDACFSHNRISDILGALREVVCRVCVGYLDSLPLPFLFLPTPSHSCSHTPAHAYSKRRRVRPPSGPATPWTPWPSSPPPRWPSPCKCCATGRRWTLPPASAWSMPSPPTSWRAARILWRG